MSWCPVAEVMPPKGHRVLIWSSTEEIAYTGGLVTGHEGELIWTEDVEEGPWWYPFEAISHWMPLPKGPK